MKMHKGCVGWEDIVGALGQDSKLSGKPWHGQVASARCTNCHSSSRNINAALRGFGISFGYSIELIELELSHPHTSLPELEPPHMYLGRRKQSLEVVACSSDCSSKVHVLHNLTGH